MEQENIMDRSLAFARTIVSYCKKLREQEEDDLAEQLFDAGTAIGKFVQEADYAETRAEYMEQMSKALQKAHVTEYWIDLLHESEYLDQDDYLSLSGDIGSILGLLHETVYSGDDNQFE